MLPSAMRAVVGMLQSSPSGDGIERSDFSPSGTMYLYHDKHGKPLVVSCTRIVSLTNIVDTPIFLLFRCEDCSADSSI